MTTQALQRAKEALIKGYKDGIYTPKQFAEALDALAALATVSDAQPVSQVGNFGDSGNEQLRQRLQNVPLPNYTTPAPDVRPSVSKAHDFDARGWIADSEGEDA